MHDLSTEDLLSLARLNLRTAALWPVGHASRDSSEAMANELFAEINRRARLARAPLASSARLRHWQGSR